MQRPIIGLTTSETGLTSKNGCERPVTFINQAYVAMVKSLDAVPLLLSCHTPLSELEHLARFLDGLVLIGGQDIHPEAFNDTPQVQYRDDVKGTGKPYLRPLDYQPSLIRDQFEIKLYQTCKSLKLPILGICRGLQLINVAEGGSLYQELPEPRLINHDRGDDGFIHHHLIHLDPQSKAFSFLQQEVYVMSSLHHQGINRLGKDLQKAAWSEDGIIEIIENIDEENFIIGVHGHIEQTRTNLKLYDTILDAFIERAILGLKRRY